MRDADLKKAGLLSYFQVVLFLVGILLFWIFCGWMARYALPFEEILKILFGCFTGRFATTFNRLQYNLQDSSIPRKAKDKNDLYQLNILGSQSLLYLGILERLNIKDTDSRERISGTALILKGKNKSIYQKIKKSGQARNIHFANIQQKAVDFLSFGLTADYRALDYLISEIAETLDYRDVLGTDEVYRQVNQLISIKRDVFSPSGINTLDKFQDIFNLLISNTNQSEIPKRRDSSTIKRLEELFTEKEELANSVAHFEQENKVLKENIEHLNKELTDLRNLMSSQRKKLEELKGKADQTSQSDDGLSRIISRKEQEYRNLEDRFRRNQGELTDLNLQTQAMAEQIQRLLQEREGLKQQLNDLVTDRFSGAGLGKSSRSLNGRFIGNISNPQRRYHFSSNCPDWWALVGQYLHGKGLGDKRIISSESPNTFERKGLNACIKCSTDTGRK